MYLRSHRIYFITLKYSAIELIMTICTLYTLENIFYFITLFDTPSLQGNINWCNIIIIVHRSLRGNIGKIKYENMKYYIMFII